MRRPTRPTHSTHPAYFMHAAHHCIHRVAQHFNHLAYHLILRLGKICMACVALSLAFTLAFSCFSTSAFAALTAGSFSPLEASLADELRVQAAGEYVYAPNMTHKGIDVSEWQGDIDWARVARTDVEFAIIRTGFGMEGNRLDYKWLQNVKGAQSVNMPFGVYHYAYCESVWEAQSEGRQVLYALQLAGLSPQTIQFPIYFDMEEGVYRKTDYWGVKLNADMFYAFKQVLNDAGYTKVGLYTSASWFASYFNQTEVEPDCIWMASWIERTTTDPYYYAPAHFRNAGIGLWQHGGRYVDGIGGEVDANLCRFDLPYYSPKGATQNMYRLYNQWTGEHLFTLNFNECADLEWRGWRYESVGWRVSEACTEEVYRLFNPHTGEHHYTIDKDEYDTCIEDGWLGEGVGFYSAASSEMPVYRLFNPYAESGYHHYTTNVGEYYSLINKGWEGEDVAWYGLG